MIEMPKTMAIGAHIVTELTGDIAGIEDNIPIIRK